MECIKHNANHHGVLAKLLRKYCSSAKPRKRLVSLSDDLEHMILTDPNGKKAPKQLYVRYIRKIYKPVGFFILLMTLPNLLTTRGACFE